MDSSMQTFHARDHHGCSLSSVKLPSSSFSPCRKPACIKIIHGEGQAGERQEELPEHRRVCVLDRTQQDLKDLYRGGKYQREPVLHFEWNQ